MKKGEFVPASFQKGVGDGNVCRVNRLPVEFRQERKKKKLLAGRWRRGEWGGDPLLRRLEVMAAWAAAMGMSKWCGGVENEANRGKEEAKNSDLDCGADSMLRGLE